MEESDSLDERIASELMITETMSIEQLRELIHLIVLFILEPAASDFQNGLSSYIDTYNINATSLKNIGAMREGWTSQKLEESCNKLNIPNNTTIALVEEWNKNKIQMISSLLSKTITANKLIDLDWSFGVTASSNDCDQVGKTFLQLKLTLDEGGQPNHVFMELSLEQFYQFLAQMENCKAYLDFVTSE